MFDHPTSDDDLVAVLVPPDRLDRVERRAFVRIVSADHRSYIGVVSRGPFFEPDAFRADAPVVVAATMLGGSIAPGHHGRFDVEILNEESPEGEYLPANRRPRPNSPVFPLTAETAAAVIGSKGDVRLGRVIGSGQIEVAVSSTDKNVFPRHTAVLGTTGSGKSNSVGNLICELHAARSSVIVIDPEGEYTALNEPSDFTEARAALARIGQEPLGLEDTVVYHLVGRQPRNPDHPNQRAFSLRFSDISPYAVMDILDLNEAQRERYLHAYDMNRRILRMLEVYPATPAERDSANEPDDRKTGWPRMELAHMYDVVAYLAGAVSRGEVDCVFRSALIGRNQEVLARATEKGSLPPNPASWRAVQGRLGSLLRMGVFDNPTVEPIQAAELTVPGRVSVIDVSDTQSPEVNSMVIASLLCSVVEQQERNFKEASRRGERQHLVEIIIEEAHQFLSAERVRRSDALFRQVADIAETGRKRWLGLAFVTQLPQHLPNDFYSLVNNWVVHKLADPQVVKRLRDTLGDAGGGVTRRLPTLAAGQAVVRMTSLAQPVVACVDPAPFKILMAE